MTEKITPGQKRQILKLVGDALDSVGVELSKDALQKSILSRGRVFQDRFRQIVRESLFQNYFLLLSDEEAVAWILKWAKKSKIDARRVVSGQRQRARTRGIEDMVKIFAEVLPGCMFKRHIPKMGSCSENFAYLQGWDFPDVPTEHCLLSWIPIPLDGSANKNVSEQTAMIASFKVEAQLPDWYELSFGSLTHVAGMALMHFNATGKDPFAKQIVRTDTVVSGGSRLALCWGRGWLNCGDWGWGDDWYENVAVCALGVVKAV